MRYAYKATGPQPLPYWWLVWNGGRLEALPPHPAGDLLAAWLASELSLQAAVDRGDWTGASLALSAAEVFRIVVFGPRR